MENRGILCIQKYTQFRMNHSEIQGLKIWGKALGEKFTRGKILRLYILNVANESGRIVKCHVGMAISILK